MAKSKQCRDGASNSEKLSEKDLKHLARLSMLILTKSQLKSLTGQLSSILGYVKILNDRDTLGVHPAHHSAGLSNVLREDAVEPSLSQKEALSNAPRSMDGYFVVPRVLK